MRDLWVFWVPLALMWILMGIEQPALNGVVARLPGASVHLAALEVAFGLALVIESPILQMLSAATALVRGKRSYRMMARFMGAWALALTTLHFLVSRPVVFSALVTGVLGVDPSVAGPAQRVFVVLLPFAAMVGFRRLWQGALIRVGNTGLVARTMIIRLVTTVAGLAGGLLWHRFSPATAPDGHIVAGIALVLGVIAGAAAAWWYFRRDARPLLGSGRDDAVRRPLQLLGFYIPLSLTSVMLLASRPILAFGISRSAQPLVSLAAWPVVQSVLFLFTSVALSYQEAAVAKAGEHPDNRRVLARFGLVLGTGLSVLLLAMATSGASRIWFERVAGLSSDLVSVAGPALTILVVMPFVVTIRSFFSGVLVSRDKTVFLGASVFANTTVMLAAVIVLPGLTLWNGARVAATAFVAANIVQLLVLGTGELRDTARMRAYGDV